MIRSELTGPQNLINANSSIRNSININKENSSKYYLENGFPSRAVVAPGVYYLGIIDILQSWTWEKELERLDIISYFYVFFFK